MKYRQYRVQYTGTILDENQNIQIQEFSIGYSILLFYSILIIIIPILS